MATWECIKKKFKRIQSIIFGKKEDEGEGTRKLPAMKAPSHYVSKTASQRFPNESIDEFIARAYSKFEGPSIHPPRRKERRKIRRRRVG
ncbi:hypothetical protein AKJ58_01665 [candidate division MSBL1 archaeon SCGC-AAA385D11]|uniref:Uncharacterized protein n=1 Tax=candidate division MSBL1 archaeon SCGC-AAA385D11 TaxID=1698286 RepID=A0A133VN20_9EURY|nr:hypothetical protein AKJ58_01665 [candidate division MSBL1 archaeon SCGC-AAA385D11]